MDKESENYPDSEGSLQWDPLQTTPCLSMMWPLREEIYNSPVLSELLWKKKGAAGEQEELMICIIKKSRVWLEYKKTYDMFLQTSIKDCVKMYKVSNKMVNFTTKSMEN